MLKERIQEVFEFTQNESPYKKANKGWINQDIFLDLSPSPDKYKQSGEAAKLTLFWAPIKSVLSNVFLIIIIGSIIVFTSVSFAKERFDFNLFNNSGINDIVNVDNNKDLNISSLEDIDSVNSTSQEQFETKNLDETNKINSFDDDLNITDEKIINKQSEEQESSIKEDEIKEDIKMINNQKTKSNFI